MLASNTFHQIIVFSVDALGIWLTILVFFSARDAKTRYLFLLTALAMFGWVNFAYFARIVQDASLSLTFLKIAWFVTPPFFALIYFFSLHVLNTTKKVRWLNYLVAAIGLLGGAFAGFTDLILADRVIRDGNLAIVYGPWMWPFLLSVMLMIGLTIGSIWLSVKDKSHKANVDSQKLTPYFFGLSVFYAANAVFNITLPIFFGITRYYYWGDYSTFVFILAVAYGVIRRELFESRTIITTVLIDLMAVLLFVDIFFLTENLEFKLVKSLILLSVFVLGAFLARSTLNEIDERKKLELAYQQLQELDDAKTEFLSIASHQLRTPISVLRGYLSMILDGDYGKVSDKAHQALDESFQNVQRLSLVVGDILNVSRIETGRLSLNRDRGDFTKLLQECVHELKPKADLKNLTLALELPDQDIAEFAFDHEKLQQVFINLIDNAIQYTQQGVISVTLENHDQQLIVSVKDNGIGIPQKEQSRIFEKFNRSSNAKNARPDGSGIGLYIAKTITELHGGEIWFESVQDEGTTFFVRLPISRHAS